MTGEGESHAKISINQRRKRRLVEKYREPVAWTTLKEDSLAELAHDVAGLPRHAPRPGWDLHLIAVG
jgi:hypothetical protein